MWLEKSFLGITVWHHSAQPCDAKQWPSDGFFHPHLTPMEDSYNLMRRCDANKKDNPRCSFFFLVICLSQNLCLGHNTLFMKYHRRAYQDNVNVLRTRKTTLTFSLKLNWAEGSQGKLIVYQWCAVRPSSTLSNWKISWDQLANLGQILYVALATEAPMGENDVFTPPSVLIQSLSNLHVMRTSIKFQTSSNFGLIRPLSTEIGTLEPLKKFP